jgi:tetratricopeptide (TPR) repeat protein
MNIGNIEGAILLLRDLVESGLRVYGDDQPELATVLQNLGTSLVLAERLDEARQVYERVVAINREWMPAANYRRALPLLSLSGIHLEQGQPAAAEAAAREALVTLNAALPAGHYITAVAECRVARALVAQGRTGEAERHFERATPPLVETQSVPEYRRECLAAAAEFHERRGNGAQAARLREVLAAIQR